MTTLRQFISLALYTILTINAVIMTLQYFLGLGNIVGKAYEVIDSVGFANIL